jgi:radical SAM protein with 4Fe4S-binding SPASM domain
LKDFFSKCHHDVRVEVGGIFEECDQCTHRESGVCAGGCLAHALNSMDNEAPVRALLRLEP